MTTVVDDDNRTKKLAAARTRALLAAAACFAGSVVSVMLGSAMVEEARWAVPVGLFAGAPAFGVVAYRAHRACRDFVAGCTKVVIAGWVRVPDGYNYAVYPSSDATREPPKVVIRLPRHRRLHSGEAWICGVDLELRKGTASLFTNDGKLIGFGRVRHQGEASKVWARSNDRPPWWQPGPFQPPHT